MNQQIFNYPFELKLESGKSLPGFQLQYYSKGKLNATKDNVIWICQPLFSTGNFQNWWHQMTHDEGPFDSSRFFIIGIDYLGGFGHSTNPLSLSMKKDQPYFHEFPKLQYADLIKSFEILRDHLGIKKIHSVVGISMGAQLALQWVADYEIAENLILMGGSLATPGWTKSQHELQRKIISQDLTWSLKHERAAVDGLDIAWKAAQLCWSNKSDDCSQIEKPKPFNAYSFQILTHMMDHFDASKKNISIKARTLILGIRQDRYIPFKEQITLHNHLNGSLVKSIDSDQGHAGFLRDTSVFVELIEEFIQVKTSKVKFA